MAAKVIVDNNLISDLFVGDEDRQQRAQEWRSRFPVWIAPDLWRYEFGNVLRSQFTFRGMERKGALEMMKQALLMVSHSTASVSEIEVLMASLDLGLTYYDACYVVHARKMGLKLLTRDGDILKYTTDISVRIDA